ncbi:nucleotidyl transferase AbiEii/AbiGii toxin family protein [Mycolicibacterium sp. XJ870]
MRASLDARLIATAAALRIDPGRLRRRLVFQRILRRIGSAENWVLKGGYLLETRLSHGFRATRDLDFVSDLAADSAALTRELERALGSDADGDYFTFRVGRAKPLTDDSAGRGGWKVSIEALLDNRTFDRVRIDVMDRLEETFGGREVLAIAAPVDGLGLADADVQSIDIAQHAAEKLHSLTKIYSGVRVSTRAKDLVDLALMLDAGLLPDRRLSERLVTVFASRDSRPPPDNLQTPPASWSSDFTTVAAGTPVSGMTMQQAFASVTEMYALAIHSDGEDPL